jgi:FixJ family two-component response regulator
MKGGAVDFLPKPFRDQDLLDAVMAAIENGIDSGAPPKMTCCSCSNAATLSPREQQVMLLVTSGKMNKQVAGDLAISEITVKIQRGGPCARWAREAWLTSSRRPR